MTKIVRFAFRYPVKGTYQGLAVSVKVTSTHVDLALEEAVPDVFRCMPDLFKALKLPDGVTPDDLEDITLEDLARDFPDAPEVRIR